MINMVVCPTCNEELTYIKTKGKEYECPLTIYKCTNPSCRSKKLAFGRFGYVQEISL